jgi:hypothetical protein
LRRRLLVEPPVPKNGTNSSNLEMDNPLSQNPGKSMVFSPIYGKNTGFKRRIFLSDSILCLMPV